MEPIDWRNISTPVIPKSKVKGENLENTVKHKIDENEKRKQKSDEHTAEDTEIESDSEEAESGEEFVEKNKRKKIDIRV